VRRYTFPQKSITPNGGTTAQLKLFNPHTIPVTQELLVSGKSFDEKTELDTVVNLYVKVFEKLVVSQSIEVLDRN